MSEPSILKKLQVNEREHHARTFAILKSEEVAAEIVGMVMARTEAEVRDPRTVLIAETDIKRRLYALLTKSLLEFTDQYVRDCEQRALLYQKVAEDALAAVTSPPITIPRKDGA